MEVSTDNLIDVGKVVGGAGLVLVPLFIKFAKAKYEKLTFTVRKIDCASLINNRVIEIRAKLGVDRVAIFEFSNGDKTVSGFPFLYSTMTYERVEEGVASMKEQFNKVPASWFTSINGYFVSASSSYGMFYSNSKSVIDGVETDTPDVTSILKGYNIVSNCIFKITSDIGDGLIVISDHHKKIVFTEEQMSQIKGDINYISTAMKQRPR